MGNTMQKILSKVKRANKDEKKGDDNLGLACLPTADSTPLDTEITQSTSVKENEESLAESSASSSIYELPNPRLPNDRQGGLPLTKEPHPSSYPVLRRWREQAAEIALNLSRHVGSVIRTALGKEDAFAEGSDSGRSSPDSRSGWDRVERSEVRNGTYDQFVKQQDAREYDHIDEREAESGDDGEEEEEVVLGGERWDRTL